MTTETSPFKRYRREILGRYGAARGLQDVVLALWNGSDYPVALGPILHRMDGQHTRILLELITHFTVKGENDREFMAIAGDIIDQRAELAAAERDQAAHELGELP
ncbi:hypothetical protein [Xanthomonas theicola]|uniref:Uncharacterized protein n=1 Tax=Xanthomonas theicola TaxID=56464 RepID=A0A2S6ZGL0_9XANT|nr:hypothetical protein [Xanthomonas theicola]PPT91394.1 hypothetical protein XthCFBP4691_07625 [Xanthomonas theicola]QNH27196.1 hypothetical protein G4Q83_22255 [Xanthomonas theicola]